MRSIVSLGFAGFVLVACVPGEDPKTPAEQVAQLKARAGSDFSCPAEQVKTSSIDDRTKVASGCGQSATYIETCESCVSGYGQYKTVDRCNCTWVLDSRRTSARD